MKKSEMIELVINEFIKDKDIIKRNLLEVMDEVKLEKKVDNCKVTLSLKWEVKNNE